MFGCWPIPQKIAPIGTQCPLLQSQPGCGGPPAWNCCPDGHCLSGAFGHLLHVGLHCTGPGTLHGGDAVRCTAVEPFQQVPGFPSEGPAPGWNPLMQRSWSARTVDPFEQAEVHAPLTLGISPKGQHCTPLFSGCVPGGQTGGGGGGQSGHSWTSSSGPGPKGCSGGGPGGGPSGPPGPPGPPGPGPAGGPPAHRRKIATSPM